MLAINTQLSGLIMWNCGKFTWGSGTNDIRVWPCFSEMAPAPAAGTRRLPKKIWSHFVVLYAAPRSHRSKPTPPLTFSASLPPFQSLCLSPHFFCLEFVNPSGFLLCTSFFLFLLHLLLRSREGQTESPCPAQPIAMARQTSVFTPLV